MFERQPNPTKFFRWLVEFEVNELWVTDGFDLTDEVAIGMLANRLGYARAGDELRAQVLIAPDPVEIKTAQGYFRNPFDDVDELRASHAELLEELKEVHAALSRELAQGGRTPLHPGDLEGAIGNAERLAVTHESSDGCTILGPPGKNCGCQSCRSEFGVRR